MQTRHLLVERLWKQIDVVSFQFLRRSSCASTWFVKEQDMTKDGCPVAHPRLHKRPEASTMTPWPSGNTNRST